VQGSQKISIVTPSYNQGQFIEQTIKSVLDQNYPNLEYIIIDGGSTDNTIEIIKKYEKYLTYWISEKDNGQTNAINKGIIKSTGDIVAYICSDDYYEKSTFRIIADYFINNTNTEMVYGGCTFVDSKSKIMRYKKVTKYNKNKLLIKNIIWQPTVFMRRKVIDKCGLFDENMDLAMDYEYWLRLLKFKIKTIGLNTNLAYYRWHENSKTINAEKKHLKEAFEIQKKYGGGSLYSWYLHNYYWPSTSKIKREIFRLYCEFKK
jgi:glycosyltransferase involved in cell wall biosynthesis